MLKEFPLNIPFVESLEQMLGYSKFIKYLVTKKRTVSFDFVDNVHHYRTIASRYLVVNKKDLEVFTIPCNIGTSNFTQALCDMGPRINMMSLLLYK